MSNSRRVSPVPTIVNSTEGGPGDGDDADARSTNSTSDHAKLVALTPKVIHKRGSGGATFGPEVIIDSCAAASSLQQEPPFHLRDSAGSRGSRLSVSAIGDRHDAIEPHSHHSQRHSQHYEMHSASPIGKVDSRRESRIIGADESDGDIGICGWILTGFSWLLVMCTFPVSLFVCLKVVQEYERAVIFRLGRLMSGGAKGPGILFILPCIDKYCIADLRVITFDVPPQEVLTKDSVTVSVDAVVYYRISNATVSIANVENAHHSTRLLAQTTLRNVLGTRNLHEILGDRESISSVMQSALDEATDSWGIKVERVEIKDVRLPVQLQRAMAAEAEAAREARAKVIAAEGEQKASRALKEASDVIAESPAALQLRYLQTLNSISAEKNSTIIFPVPIEFMAAFGRKT